jgi:hypothetical protein
MQVVNTGSSRPILQAQFTPCLWNTTSHIRGIPADSRGVTNENTYKGDLARLGYDLGDARHEEMHALHVACGQEQFSYLAGKCQSVYDGHGAQLDVGGKEASIGFEHGLPARCSDSALGDELVFYGLLVFGERRVCLISE